ncbi:MAG: hypothetical protein NDJ92_09420 [Thermoanaerobaculia bacterium]|nr:hypothetical protein [Thermoanaerobaculia bacterium]
MKTMIAMVVLVLALGASVSAADTALQASGGTMTSAARPAWIDASAKKMEDELAARYGDASRSRLARGLRQVSSLWIESDGDAAEFESFVRENFAGDEATYSTLLSRMDFLHEQLDGCMLELGRAFRWQSDLDLGEMLPIDEISASYDPGAHVNDDFFANKVAFVVLLNFPLTTLDEKLASGASWTPAQWAATRLADRYGRRIPAEVNQKIAVAFAEAESYIASYNVWMHHLVDEKGKRLFPPKLRLITHWNLRDELKAQYGEKDGLPRQRMIQQVMERIVTQTIPQAVIDNPTVDWNPKTNQVVAATVSDSDRKAPEGMKVTSDREPDTRYARLLGIYRASRLADPYSPAAPSMIARRFNDDRELPEARVEAMLVEVLSSPMVPKVAKVIEKRLGRKLEPFDIWYNGFKARGAYTSAQLDEITKKKYPTPEAFGADIPNILAKLGFSEERAKYVAERVTVDSSRGAGHAMGAQRRGDKAHLRTRVGKDGMDYKGYNIAVHELGHNVEQTFSLYDVPFNAVEGVPNTAFTEALAFVFQAKDLELLGLAKPDEMAQAMTTLGDFWATYEIAGVAIVDMRVWRWMYANPEATPEQLRVATLGIARDVWNEFYAPVFRTKDVVLLGVYSHMVSNGLYLPDYPIGHLIAHQIEEQMERAGNIGVEFERMTKQGRMTPDLWMTKATGAPVGPEAMLKATEKALARVSAK